MIDASASPNNLRLGTHVRLPAVSMPTLTIIGVPSCDSPSAGSPRSRARQKERKACLPRACTSQRPARRRSTPWRTSEISRARILIFFRAVFAWIRPLRKSPHFSTKLPQKSRRQMTKSKNIRKTSAKVARNSRGGRRAVPRRSLEARPGRRAALPQVPVYIYIYIYMNVYVCMNIYIYIFNEHYIYIYIYIHTYIYM